MRAVLQRVTHATVQVEEKVIGEIKSGLLILLGIEAEDGKEDLEWLVRKISQMRIFPDENKVMNKSIVEHSGSFLVVSQFTLYASTKKGNRPSYKKAAHPDIAIPLYEKFIATLQSFAQLPVATGKFGADMKVTLVNDGPVTIIIDSKNRN